MKGFSHSAFFRCRSEPPPPDLNVPVTPNVIGSPASVVVTGSPVPGAKIKGFVFELVGPNGKVKRYSSKKAAKAWKKESLKTPGVWLVRYHVKLKKGSSPWSPVNQFTVLESEVSKPRGKK